MIVPPEYILNWYELNVICRWGHLKEASLLRLALIYTSQHTVSFTSYLKPQRRSNKDKHLRTRSKGARNQRSRQHSHMPCHYIHEVFIEYWYMGDRAAILPPNSSLIMVRQLWWEHEGRSLLNYKPQMSIPQGEALAWPILMLSRRSMRKLAWHDRHMRGGIASQATRIHAYMATTGVVNVNSTIQLDIAGCPLTCLKQWCSHWDVGTRWDLRAMREGCIVSWGTSPNRHW